MSISFLLINYELNALRISTMLKLHTNVNVNSFESICNIDGYLVTDLEQRVLILGISQLQGKQFLAGLLLKSLDRSSIEILVAMRLVEMQDGCCTPVSQPDYVTVESLAEELDFNVQDEMVVVDMITTEAVVDTRSSNLTILDL